MTKHENEAIKVYHKPTCSKCRSTVKILKERGVEFEAINYYETPPTAPELKKPSGLLGVSPRELVRKEEQVYRDLGLRNTEISDDQLIELMVANPDLIQRPIVVRGNKAILGRPPENVEELL
jgi:arsenate reductase (glutaredoxin)